jgi:protein-S-isoprenylcysteine O-methyltransferase Ste14
MTGLVVVGLAFCWWARLHLGRLWSGTVTRKEGHHVVDTGPYALVRHPIYTGLILAGFATAIARGAPLPLAAAAVATFAWYLKARIEERLLSAELGEHAYAAYAARTPMLVPFPRL